MANLPKLAIILQIPSNITEILTVNQVKLHDLAAKIVFLLYFAVSILYGLVEQGHAIIRQGPIFIIFFDRNGKILLSRSLLLQQNVLVWLQIKGAPPDRRFRVIRADGKKMGTMNIV
jgi:hypothetical protein